MSSVAFVNSTQVIQMNEISYGACPRTENIPCEGTQIQGLWWAEPTVYGGAVNGYKILKGDSRTNYAKPSTDSIRVIRVYNIVNDYTYYLAVADGDTESVFVDRCNACCGTTPVMPTVTIPAPIIEDAPCPDVPNGTPTYTFNFAIPANPNSLKLALDNFTFNGVAGTPTPVAPPTGYVSAATILTWVQANWGAYGTWSLQNTSKDLRLVSTSTESAGGTIDLIAASYCFQIPGTATETNGITIGATNVSFPNIFFDDTTEPNRNAIINAIAPYFANGYDDLSIVEDTGDFFVKYTGLQLPVHLLLDGSTVSGTTFATGTCP